MRSSRGIAAAICALGALVSAGCSPKSEILVVIDTDQGSSGVFSRVDAIVLEERGGEFVQVADTTLTATTGFPATWPLVTPADPSRTYKIKVVATQQVIREDGTVVQSEVGTVTKLVAPPLEGESTVRFPLQFLCNPSICQLQEGKACCPGEDLCQQSAGSESGCVPFGEKARSEGSYDPTRIWGGGMGDGGGACFDAVRCFDGKTPVTMPAMAGCKFDVSAFDVEKGRPIKNVGLVTKKHGACGFNGCYVPLDAMSDPKVWRTEGNQIVLPPRVCKWLQPPDQAITGVVATDDTDTNCPVPKTVGLPLCGPTSTSGGDTPYYVVLAKDQAHPVSIAVDGSGDVYWVNLGTLNGGTLTGSAVRKLGADKPFNEFEDFATSTMGIFRDLAVDGGLVFWTVADTAGKGKVMCSDAPCKTQCSRVVVDNLNMPEGIARYEDKIYWTDRDGSVKSASTKACELLKQDPPPPEPQSVQDGLYPFRVAAYKGGACWTNAGSGDKLGGVACHGDITFSSTGLKAPRGIAIYSDASATPIFGAFAEFVSGNVFVVPDLTSPLPFLISGQDHPSGVAVDADYVYWTDWAAGTVSRASRHGCLTQPPPQPETLATGQKHPSAITVHGNAVYWINEGSVGKPDGSVVVRAKPPVDAALIEMLRAKCAKPF